MIESARKSEHISQEKIESWMEYRFNNEYWDREQWTTADDIEDKAPIALGAEDRFCEEEAQKNVQLGQTVNSLAESCKRECRKKYYEARQQNYIDYGRPELYRAQVQFSENSPPAILIKHFPYGQAWCAKAVELRRAEKLPYPPTRTASFYLFEPKASTLETFANKADEIIYFDKQAYFVEHNLAWLQISLYSFNYPSGTYAATHRRAEPKKICRIRYSQPYFKEFRQAHSIEGFFKRKPGSVATDQYFKNNPYSPEKQAISGCFPLDASPK